jgi:hypothetical protein
MGGSVAPACRGAKPMWNLIKRFFDAVLEGRKRQAERYLAIRWPD